MQTPVNAHDHPSVRNSFFCFTGADPPGEVPPPLINIVQHQYPLIWLNEMKNKYFRDILYVNKRMYIIEIMFTVLVNTIVMLHTYTYMHVCIFFIQLR